MPRPSFAHRLSYVYLCLVPIVTFVLAFVTGHISYRIYVPVWILNLIVMFLALRVLSAGAFRGEPESRHLAVAGCLLVLPAGILAILFGIGPPPETREEWVATTLEQKIRFDALLAAGIIMVLGWSLIKRWLDDRGEKVYSSLGHTALLIALPLFLVVTSYWHSFALEAYKVRIQSGTPKSIDWFIAASLQVWVITICEIALTYFAIAMFASALKKLRVFSRPAAVAYIAISLVALVAVLGYPLYPGSAPFSGFPYYPFMIPAVPIMLCYYIGFNLVRLAGRKPNGNPG
ncbi:MAG TPA: hypothetical protein VHE34_22210 [Puia sp.]|uniref:hypothetical protein n=1 Tax=Puia sp. TaxID=2045100 RepID=UPI002CB7CB27|nr:hypothetical protein [Puia sp.]HVU97961.1 hypothetical protein [Puia sp.]